eukprot:scaffold47783_cov53-Attheya_sp.AAC.3
MGWQPFIFQSLSLVVITLCNGPLANPTNPLEKEVEGIGDQAVFDGETKKVGKGGLLGGVKLAVSDKDDQARNKQMLEAFFRKEERRRRKEAKRNEKSKQQETSES